jgi:hypothetical protein
MIPRLTTRKIPALHHITTCLFGVIKSVASGTIEVTIIAIGRYINENFLQVLKNEPATINIVIDIGIIINEYASKKERVP